MPNLQAELCRSCVLSLDGYALDIWSVISFFGLMCFFWKLVRHLALSKALWQGAQDQSEDVRRAAAGQLGRVEACHTELQSSTSIIFNLKIQEDRSRVRQNIQTS